MAEAHLIGDLIAVGMTVMCHDRATSDERMRKVDAICRGMPRCGSHLNNYKKASHASSFVRVSNPAPVILKKGVTNDQI